MSLLNESALQINPHRFLFGGILSANMVRAWIIRAIVEKYPLFGIGPVKSGQS